MTSSGAIMPRARVVAQNATIDMTGLSAQLGFDDPLHALVERVRPVAARSVDALQIAASLESSGMTDRAARVEFGFVDVFDLAEEIHRRITPAPDPPRLGSSRNRAAELRDIGHGALYLVPVAVFPAALAGLGNRTLVGTVVLVAAVCWIFSGVTAWLAYRLLGERKPGSAGALLRWSSFAALPIAAAVAAVMPNATGIPYNLIALAIAQMAYQMAATVLVFYHREGLLFGSMVPAVAACVGYFIAGPALRPVAIGLSAGSVAVTFGIACWQTTRAGRAERPLPQALREQLRPLWPVLAFTTLSAAFFLYPLAAYALDRPDVTIAMLPMITGMGVVEWRARRFGVDARALLARVYHPEQFAVRIQRLLRRGLGTCLAAVSVLATVLLAVLAWIGRLTTAGAVMAATGVVLAGAYFLGFLLANMGRYGWLCGSLLLCLGGYATARSLAPGGALGDTIAFLGATSLLILLYLAALARSIEEAHRHR